jgi:cysteine desulfurase / selenocysteine lyase
LSGRARGVGTRDLGPRTYPMSRRANFPLLVRNPDLHYLDTAATSQKPGVVLDAMRDFYEADYANPHRGAYALSVRATERYVEARERVARFFGVGEEACLIFTRGTTESLNLVAGGWGRANVGPGDEVVLTAMDHHSNFVPWQQLAVERGARFAICELTADGRVDFECLTRLVTRRTKVVAFNHVSNALGTINPVREIAALAHSVGAIAVCDGAQSAPHFATAFTALGVDFFAFSGHKMCGPMAIGGLIGRRDLLERMPPYQMGGDMIEFVHDERTTWNILPHKFEAGTPNVAGAVGLAAACDYLESVGLDNVHRHDRALMALASERLAALEGVTVHGPRPDLRSGIVSFSVADIHPHDVATVLDQEGVCIRAGHHCCQPLMRRLGVAGTARASFYMYNDEADVDALVAGVETAKELFARAGS